MVEVLGKHLGTRQPLRCFMGKHLLWLWNVSPPDVPHDGTEVICHLWRADTDCHTLLVMVFCGTLVPQDVL